MSEATDYDKAGELKFGQVGIANLRIRRFDIDALVADMHERVTRAPKLFARAAMVIDLGGLSTCPGPERMRELLDGLHGIGVCPVALAYGTREIEELAQTLGMPLLAKFRENYERGGNERSEREQRGNPRPAPPRVKTASPVATPTGALIHDAPVRSGQQLYAQARDLVVTGTVGAGAEIIADGSIHVYGTLRGRALAGASGDTSTRIFCRDFDAELVAIAGHYRVIEELPEALRNRPAQVLYREERLEIEAMS